eukprot:gene35340-biopygen27932
MEEKSEILKASSWARWMELVKDFVGLMAILLESNWEMRSEIEIEIEWELQTVDLRVPQWAMQWEIWMEYNLELMMGPRLSEFDWEMSRWEPDSELQTDF